MEFASEEKSRDETYIHNYELIEHLLSDKKQSFETKRATNGEMINLQQKKEFILFETPPRAQRKASKEFIAGFAKQVEDLFAKIRISKRIDKKDT